VLGMNRGRSLLKILFALLLVALLVLSSAGTPGALAAGKAKLPKTEKSKFTGKVAGTLAETPPPSAIQDLRKFLENYQPQVTILSPKPNEVLSDNSVSVRFQVRDLPIFKSEKLGLGPHLHVLLDNRTYQAVYDLSKPLVFDQLEPGTHTIRAFASRPWHESFKNEGAYTQVSFHVFTKTGENSPNPDLPLLTYSRPQGTYGAEPIMLDFYLTNAPLHLIAQESSKDDIVDWRIRCTINGESFILDQWQPIYLKGFKPGKNWVQLEFLDENGNPVNNVFNNTARVITYEPNGQDALSRLVRGELSAAEARSMVDPNYVPEEPAIAPVPSPSPSPKPALEASPSPIPVVPPVQPAPSSTPSPRAKATPGVKATPTPTPTASPVTPAKPKTRTPSPAPERPRSEPSPRLGKEEPSRTEEPLEKPAAPKLETPKPEVAKPEAPKPETPKPEAPKPEAPKPEASPPSKSEARQPKEAPGLPGFLNRFRPLPKAVAPSPKPGRPVPSPAVPSPSRTPTEEEKTTQIPPRATESPKPSPVPTQSPPPSDTTSIKERKPQPSSGSIAPSKPPSPKPPEPSPSPSGPPGRREPPARAVQPSPQLPTPPTPKSIPQRLERPHPSPSPIAPSPTPAPAKAIVPARPTPAAPQAPKPQPSVSPTPAPNRSPAPKSEVAQPESKVPENTKPSPDTSKPVKKPTASDFYERLRRARTSPTTSPSPVPPVAAPSTGEPAPPAKPAVPGGTVNPKV
jgi:hypothetical protein